jgi:hypothetical protein
MIVQNLENVIVIEAVWEGIRVSAAFLCGTKVLLFVRYLPSIPLRYF